MRDYWITTKTGKRFSYTKPSPEDVCMEDILIALSREGRYANHTNLSYTVGQHCWLCSVVADPEIAVQAFVHDFAEAYTRDLPSDFKALLNDLSLGVWDEIETGIEAAVCEALDVDYPFDPRVKEVDRLVFTTEVRDVLVEPDPPWEIELPTPLAGKISPWTEQETYTHLKFRWEELSLPTI